MVADSLFHFGYNRIVSKPTNDDVAEQYANVCGFVRKQCPTASNEDVEDIVGEVMMRAIRHIDRYTGQAKLSTWMASIAIRCIIDRHRKANSKPQTLELFADGEFVIDTDAESRMIESAEVQISLNRSAEHAPYETMIVVLASHGHTAREIAAIIQVPTKEMKRKLGQIKRTIKDNFHE